MANMADIFKRVKKASKEIASAGALRRRGVLDSLSRLLNKERDAVKAANALDMDYACESGLSSAMTDRLRLTDREIDSMIKAVEEIKNQEEAVGSSAGGSLRPNGLRIERVRVPLGVVGMVYESRPNVTVDSAALCIKSGNAAVLRGGKEAVRSNTVLASLVRRALKENGLPEDCIYFVSDTDRAVIGEMASARGYIDVIIPRGGSGLINYVAENAKIPVIMHDKGVCHTFIDKYADRDMAMRIAFNAKVQRPSACNAMETLLIHKDIAPDILPEMSVMFKDVGVDLRCDGEALKYMDGRPAIEEDWGAEFHDMILAVRVVSDMDEAIDHIARYGSGHSEAIVTENYSNARKFLEETDAAAVYVNASTRFTDGGEFGLGAEIGISTQKLHVRGPMGAADLTTTKYMIYGSGQLRS